MKAVAQCKAAIFSWGREAMQAKIAHLPPQVDACGKAVGSIDGCCVWGNHTLCKVVHLLSKRFSLVIHPIGGGRMGGKSA